MKNKLIKEIKRILKENEWNWDNDIKKDYDSGYLLDSRLLIILGELDKLLFDLSEHTSQDDAWISASVYVRYTIIFNHDVDLDLSTVESLADDLVYLNEQAKQVIKEVREGIKI